MVVNITKFRDIPSHRHIGEKFMELGPHQRLKAASYLSFEIRPQADFVISDTTKDKFILVGAKKGLKQERTTRKAQMEGQPILENRLGILEEQFNKLVSSTWEYIFGKENIVKMSELSKGMLEDSKKIQELSEQLKEVDDGR